MLIFTLAISCLTTSYLPWFMDLTFQVPMQYCSLQHWTLLPWSVTSTTGCFFLLWLNLFILSWAISPLFSSSMLSTYWPGEFIFQCHIFLPFSYCSWHSQGKNTEVVCHSLLHWNHILSWWSSVMVVLSWLHQESSLLGGPTGHDSEFHWVRQGFDPCDQFALFSVIVVFIVSAL